MKKIMEIKETEIESLSDFQEHIGIVLYYMDMMSGNIDDRSKKQMAKCYRYLDNLWESIEVSINKIYELKMKGEKDDK